MRILYIDIDSLRPDHLGCYGYHRNTSPTIDQIAREGVVCTNYYVSDSPCLPSRTAFFAGRFGVHNGVTGHGGKAAEPFKDGAGRGFESSLGKTSLMRCLRDVGLHTASISSFPERHSAFHWTANLNEHINPGHGGLEHAHQVIPLALDWLRRHAETDNWFLHVNLWDPHTPYYTPDAFGNPFADEPLPAWLTEAVRQQHWWGGGPHSAQEVWGFESANLPEYPKQPTCIDSMAAVRAMFDGYDCGVRYADDHIRILLDELSAQDILDATMIVISADHGENLGELNVYCDHQTADHITNRVPLIVRAPGLKPRLETGLLYHVDFAATLVEWVGGTIPSNWNGRGFANALATGGPIGRDHLILSHGAWTCQRSVRFDDYLLIRSYHDGYHNFPDLMLFDLIHDPHEQHNLAAKRGDLVGRGIVLLEAWHTEMMRTATHPYDPFWSTLHEGGPLHVRGELPSYLERLRRTGRTDFAETLLAKHSLIP